VTVRRSSPANEDPFALGDDAGSRKGFRDGTHRLVPPARTLERMRPLMPVMGITRLANLTGLDVLRVPVVMAIRPNARSLAVSSGKGLTLEAAMASGLMEAIELYHAERVRGPLMLARFEEISHSGAVVDVTRLPRLSVSRYHPGRRILWVEGHDLLGRAPRFVPYELVHADFTLPLPAGSGCFPMSSNGLASGNHVLEAVSHAICEVVERDATSLWRLRPPQHRQGRRVDLDTVDDPVCRRLLDLFDEAGLSVGLWDVTSDLQVPVFECLTVDREDQPIRAQYATSGIGCHPSPGVAAARALTEAAQGRMIYIAGSRDDRDREAYEEARDPELNRHMRERIEGEAPRRDFRRIPRREHESFAAEVRWELERLAAVGIEEAVVVDLTRPEFGVPVVRAVIPGLEGIAGSPGYVPGARARAAAAA
jgi:ribosomal protein S12 methylthiotransferase accessory factor